MYTCYQLFFYSVYPVYLGAGGDIFTRPFTFTQMTEDMKKIVFTTETFFNPEVSEMCVSIMIGFKRVD